MKYLKTSKVFYIFFLLNGYTSKAQPGNVNKYLKLSTEVKFIDSEYIVKSNLVILKKGLVIQLHKKLSSSNENNLKFDCQIFLKKKIKNVYVNMYVPYIAQLPYDDDFYKLRHFAFGDSISVSTDLENICPLEIGGQYRVSINLSYFYNGLEYEILSNDYEFKVNSEPKYSRWR